MGFKGKKNVQGDDHFNGYCKFDGKWKKKIVCHANQKVRCFKNKSSMKFIVYELFARMNLNLFQKSVVILDKCSACTRSKIRSN